MNPEFKYDAFLSHNRADKPRVRKLAERLKQAGLRVWFDEWTIKAGDDIYLAIERGLEAARVQVLCLSPAALGSEWVTLERSTVLFRDPTNQGRRFVPLLLADCTLPDTLRRYKYVDFRDESDAAFAELLTVCIPAKLLLEPDAGHVAIAEHITDIPVGSWSADGTATGDPYFGRKTRKKQPSTTRNRFEFKLIHALKAECYAYRLAWSPNGHEVAAGCEDGAIRIWDATSGDLRHVLRHTSSVPPKMFAVAYAPNGQIVAVAGEGGEITFWNPENGKRVCNLAGHPKDIWDLAFSPDGNLLASASDDGSVGLWNVSTRENESFLDGGSVEMWGARFSRSGRTIVSGSTDGRVHVWDVEGRVRVKSLPSHMLPVFSVAFSPDNRFCATCSVDRLVRIWTADTMELLATLEGHQDSIEALDFSFDGTLLATKSLDGTVLVWSCDEWEVVGRLKNPIDSRWHPGLAFHPSKRILGTLGSCDRELHLWQLFGTERSSTNKASSEKYASAKVVLLGESGVGKTALAHRLVEDRYVRTDSTHGMNVWRLELPLPDTERIEHEVLLWDLAGQMSFREIHQLFLDQTTIAIVLVNPHKSEPFAEAGDWLSALQSATQRAYPDVVKLLITTRHDVGGAIVSDKKIGSFLREHGFAAWLSTSAKTGENCSDQANAGQPSKLKQLIADSVPWDKLPWTATPRLLAELKNALLKMRDTTDIRLLRFAELAQRLEQTLPGERFGESDVRTAVSLLANHGLARPLKFGDLVLLQPELLNGYAGAIIRSARAHKDEIGCVREADIYDPKFDFTGIERLKHRPDEELLLRAMVQTFLDHSLCIAEETTEGRHLVFPSQYRREKDLPHEPDIFVSYTFSGEWQTVWTTLVVRLWYSQEFAHRELWRNAAEFESSKGQTLGLKIAKTGDGTATISLYFDVKVPDELKVIFIEYVHRHLAKYACEVTRDRRYVCPACGKPVKDLDAVRERLDAKKTFIICQKCDEKVPFIDFIEQRLKSDPVARKILAMDETATRELDTQALEQILIGHMMAIAGEANQIFRPVTMFDYGIDGEVEFKDNDGKASGKRIYIQLKSGNSYLRNRKGDGSEVFDVTNDRHLEYWVNQPVDVYLVIRQTDDLSGQQVIRWMNVTRYLKARKDKKSRQILFDGAKLDMEAVWKVRDEFFPPKRGPAGRG